MAEKHFPAIIQSLVMEISYSSLTIVISTDAEGLKRHATLIASIVRRTERSVEVRCYTRGFAQKSFETRNLRVDFVRVDEEVTGRYPRHVAAAVFDRLRIIRDETGWGRCLVLDHDMVCLSDLGEYFDESFDGNLLMGRLFGPGNTLGLQMRGRGGLPERLSHAEEYPYFFMGPMMNLTAMREESIWDRFLAVHEILNQDEQLALAAATGGRTKGVDRKWNQVPQWDCREGSEFPEGDEGCGIRLEGIIHWTGGAKPWHPHTKVWRPEVWEAERTNWEVLRAGEWDKPVMWELSGSPASELLSWLTRGWKLVVAREDVPVPALPEGTLLSEEVMRARADEWSGREAEVWERLLDHPDVAPWAEIRRVAAMGDPEVLVVRDLEHLRDLLRLHGDAQLPPYVVLRRNNDRAVTASLAEMGYDWQWCRAGESAGAVAEGVDYLEGPWSGEMPEGCELLGWRATAPGLQRQARRKGCTEMNAVV